MNHLAAHVAVDELEHGPLAEPSIALLVSGGHSSLLLVPDLARDVESLGPHRRRRGGRGLRQGRPACSGCRSRAGPPIDRAARDGDPAAIALPARARPARATPPYDFSFSGLKTAVARWVEARERAGEPVPVADVAASFQEAVADVLTAKAVRACRDHGVDHLVLGGGRRGQLAAARAGRGALRRRPASCCGCPARGCAPTTARWSPRSARGSSPPASRRRRPTSAPTARCRSTS